MGGGIAVLLVAGIQVTVGWARAVCELRNNSGIYCGVITKKCSRPLILLRFFCAQSVRRVAAVLGASAVVLLSPFAAAVGDSASAQEPFFRPARLIVDAPRDRVFVLNYGSGSVTALKATTKEVVRQVVVAPRVSEMAVDEETGDLYLLDGTLNAVVRITSSAWQQASVQPQRVAVGRQPVSLAFDSRRGRLYVVNFLDHSVSVLDAKKLELLQTLSVGRGPRAVVVSSQTGTVYVANEIDGSISVLVASAADTSKTINLPIAPRHLTIDEARGVLYAAPYTGNSVVRIPEATQLVQELAVGRDPRALALDPTSGELYVSVFTGNALVKVAASGHVSATLAFPDGSFPGQPALDARTGMLYVPLTGNARVAMVDTRTMTIAKMLASGTNTDQAALNAAAGEVYFVNPESDTLTIIDTATDQVAYLPEGRDPQAVVRRGGPVFDFPTMTAVNEGDNLVYALNNIGAFLTVIDGRSDAALRTVPVSRNPRAALYVPEVRKLYVSSGDDDVVEALDREARKVLQRIPVGQKPRFMRYHAPTKRLFVINQDSNSVSVIDAAKDTIVATIKVGKTPYWIQVAPTGSRLAVVNAADSSVSLIDAEELREVGRVVLAPTVDSVVFPAAGARAFVLLRSPSAVAVVDTESAKLEKILPLSGDASFVAAAAGGVVIGQNLRGGVGELVVLNPQSLTMRAPVRIDRALSQPGWAAVRERTDEVFFFDLGTRQRLQRFEVRTQSVSDVANVTFPISHASLNQQTGKLYAAHAFNNAVSVVDVGSGRVVKVLDNKTPLGYQLSVRALVAIGAIAAIVWVLVTWPKRAAAA